MDKYGYPYPSQEAMMPGNAYGDYYPMDVMGSNRRDKSDGIRSPGRRSPNQSRSRSPSKKSRSSDEQSETSSRSRTSSALRRRFQSVQPSFLDAFRIMYLTPKPKSSKYLATQKQRDIVKEMMKTDGLGSKRWWFYPRKSDTVETIPPEESTIKESDKQSDKRIKIDRNFLRRYKKNGIKIDEDAPIAKLKKWELKMYKKLGFIQAV